MAHLLAALLLSLASLSAAQQPYLVNNPQLNCYANNGSSVLGYNCSSSSSSASCFTFLTFRSLSPYGSASAISSLLNSSSPQNISALNPTDKNNDLVVVPSTCACTGGGFYQHNATYTIKSTGETYLLIANNTYQGLSTCQALIAQNPDHPSTNLTAGMRILVPIRCACPSANQTKHGIKYLVNYLITWGDNVSAIAQRFGADYADVLAANSLSEGETIFPFTTLLVPVKTEPRGDSVQAPPPPSPSPKPSTPPPPADDSGDGSGNKWVFIGIGIGVGFLVLCGAVLSWYYFCCYRRRRGRQLLDEMPTRMEQSSNEYGALSGKTSSAPFVSSEIRSFLDTLVVYKFSDLEKATGYYGEDHRIKGSVYRALINGDDAAVKRLKGDVSNEIKILKQINHANVVRLSGFCVHEGDTYLVYEFAEKGSLADWIHHHTHNKDWSDSVLGWKERARLAYDVADGLNYLHNYTNPPYVHKNLKSSNILLDGEFRAKLANFRLARPVEEESEGVQLTRHVVGTQGYMAPEYLEHGLVTPKLDVFAFGVVVLELLSGKEATYAKDGDEKGEVMLWKSIREVMSGEDVRAKLKEFMDPCLGSEYPFDLVFAVAELAARCVAAEPGSRPAMAEVFMSLLAIYNSTLDWDPSDVGNSGSMVHGR